MNVTPVSGQALDDLKAHIELLGKIVKHMEVAARDMSNAITSKDQRLLTSAVMNSRNWTASAVVNHCYIQTLLGANPSDQYSNSYLMAKYHLYNLFHRAAQMGAADAVETRMRLQVKPSDAHERKMWDINVANRQKRP